LRNFSRPLILPDPKCVEPAFSLAAIWRDLAAFTRDTAQVGQIGANAGEGKDDVMTALFE